MRLRAAIQGMGPNCRNVPAGEFARQQQCYDGSFNVRMADGGISLWQKPKGLLDLVG
jgi:hypothetical protein